MMISKKTVDILSTAELPSSMVPLPLPHISLTLRTPHCLVALLPSSAVPRI